MPPRYAYWTIIVDNQPTAFRSGTQEELMPTFKRLKAKNDSAVMMWWQNGKLWPSRVDAQEAMIGRGDAGRRSDPRQEGAGFRERERKPTRERSAWTPRGEPSTPAPSRNANDKLDWKPKGEFVPAPKRADRSEWSKPERSGKPDWKSKSSFDRERKPDWKAKPSSPSTYAKASVDKQAFKPSRSEKPEWKPKSFKRPDYKPSADESRSPKPEWKPKGSFDRESKPEWKPKGSFDRERKPDWKSKPSTADGFTPSRSEKPEWKPKGSFTPAPRRPAGFGEPEWKSKSSGPSTYAKASVDKRAFKPRSEKPAWKPNRDSGGRFSPPDGERAPRTEKLDWKPKGEGTRATERPSTSPPERRKWVPKEEYKRSMGIEAKRDAKWRPGGEHKDPRQKFKDAKKAKWSKFKQNIRARSGGKGKKSS